MNKNNIPANDTYWDYRMLQIINGKRKETIADRIAKEKAKRKAEILDKIGFAICIAFGYGCILYLLLFAP